MTSCVGVFDDQNFGGVVLFAEPLLNGVKMAHKYCASNEVMYSGSFSSLKNIVIEAIEMIASITIFFKDEKLEILSQTLDYLLISENHLSVFGCI